MFWKKKSIFLMYAFVDFRTATPVCGDSEEEEYIETFLGRMILVIVEGFCVVGGFVKLPITLPRRVEFVVFNVGRTVKFECTATGDGPPKVTVTKKLFFTMSYLLE